MPDEIIVVDNGTGLLEVSDAKGACSVELSSLNDEEGVVENGSSKKTSTDGPCFRMKTRRQLLLQKQTNGSSSADYSQYSLDDFLKAKPPSNFNSRSSSSGNSSKQ